MRRPKNWTTMLNRGFMTTDMIDGCLLHLVKTRTVLMSRIARLSKENEEKPTKGRKNRIADAKRRLYRTQCKYDYLLGATEVQAVVSYTNAEGKHFHYAIHRLGERTYLRPVTPHEAKGIAQKAGLTITKTRTVRFPTYDLENVPSFATVSEAIATIASSKVTHIADTGNFDPKSYEEAGAPCEVDEETLAKVKQFCVWYADAYASVTGDKEEDDAEL